VTELVTIRLLGLPVALNASADEHHADLMRELALVAVSDDETTARIPRRVVDLVRRVETRYGGYTEVARRRLSEARERGEPEVDLELRVPPAAGAAAAELLDQLEEADRFCREGDLLTLAAPPEIVAFRRWSLGEVTQQIAGRAPVPWSAVAPDTAGRA
jgi:hypothetical protein